MGTIAAVVWLFVYLVMVTAAWQLVPKQVRDRIIERIKR